MLNARTLKTIPRNQCYYQVKQISDCPVGQDNAAKGWQRQTPIIAGPVANPRNTTLATHPVSLRRKCLQHGVCQRARPSANMASCATESLGSRVSATITLVWATCVCACHHLLDAHGCLRCHCNRLPTTTVNHLIRLLPRAGLIRLPSLRRQWLASHGHCN